MRKELKPIGIQLFKLNILNDVIFHGPKWKAPVFSEMINCTATSILLVVEIKCQLKYTVQYPARIFLHTNLTAILEFEVRNETKEKLEIYKLLRV